MGQRLREREEPRDRFFGVAELHLNPVGCDRHPRRKIREPPTERLGRDRDPNAGEPGLSERGEEPVAGHFHRLLLRQKRGPLHIDYVQQGHEPRLVAGGHQLGSLLCIGEGGRLKPGLLVQVA